LFLLLLGGCAGLPEQEGPLPSGAFEVAARVAVRYGEEAASGRVAWRHSANRDDLLISNPIGQGMAEITGRRGDYVLRTADGKEFKAPDAESLTEQTLGWALPLSGLPDWIRGRAAPGSPAQTIMKGERLGELRQLGWHIEYLAWDETQGLPQRMRLRRDDLDIRLAIESWQLGQ
jgi:outer membrane lipoprotein LolB